MDMHVYLQIAQVLTGPEIEIHVSEGRPESPRRGSASSTSPSLLDEIHAQIIEVDPARPPIPKKRSKSPNHLAPALAASAAMATDDDDENLESLSREIVDEMEEDDAGSGTRRRCCSGRREFWKFYLGTRGPRNKAVLGAWTDKAASNIQPAQPGLGEVTRIQSYSSFIS